MEEFETTVIETAEGAGTPDQPTGEPEGIEEVVAPDPGAEPPKKKAWFQERIDEVTRDKYEARREAEQARREAEYWREQATRQQTPEQETFTRPRPTREQFDHDEDQYLEALTDWKLEQREEKVRAETQRRQQAEQARTIQQKAVEITEKGRSEFQDYELVANNPSTPISTVVAQAILESDMGHKVAYYLGKNPQEAARIATLPPVRQLAEVGKLEVKLSQSPVKQTTAAPPPITPVGGRTAATSDPDKLLKENPKEWMRLRNEGKI